MRGLQNTRIYLRPIIFLYSFWPLILFSQAKELQFNFQKLGIEEGLSDNHYNNFVFQDSKGFTWISSINGLNRFDGINVKIYRQDSGMLGNNIQSSFYEDQESNIWFSTFEALNCYHRARDSIIAFTLSDQSGQLLNHDYKVFHLDHNKQRLWLRAGSSVFGLDTRNPKSYFQLPFSSNGNHYSISQDSLNQQLYILESPSRNADSVAIRIIQDTVQISFKKYLPNNEKKLKKSIPFASKQWIFFTKNKLFLFAPDHSPQVSLLNNKIEAQIHDVVRLNKNQLLVSTKKQGLWLYNLTTNQFVQKWKQEDNNYSLSTNQAREINLTRDKICWIAHRNKGLDYSYLFNNAFYNPIDSIIPEDVEIVSILEDHQQRVWVGTRFKGIYVFSKTGKYLETIHSFQRHPIFSELWQIQFITDQKLWGITKKGIFQYDLKTKKIQVLFNSAPYAFRFVTSIYPNRKIISSNEGLKEIVYDEQDYKIIACPEFKDFPSFSFLQIYQTTRKKVYIPFNANELWVYNATDNGLVLIKKIKCNLEFFGFTESKKYAGTIWAGTSQGLMQIIKDTIIQPVFSKTHSLGNGNVYSILEANEGVLWITNNQGLWQYFPERKQVFQFAEEDGVSGVLFSLYNSSLYSSNTNIWLGNNRGLVKFSPHKIEAFSKVPRVYINQLFINDTEVRKDIGMLDQLIVDHDKNTLSFDISPITYYKPEKCIIHYQLENYDDQWLSIEQGQSIRYTKIPPGKYTLKVKAVDSNFNASTIKTIDIRIKPPIWKTWWFLLLMGFLFLRIIYAIYRYRIIQIRKDEEKKTAIAQLKLQVLDVEMKALRAQMNPHFLFNSMNSIKGIIIKKEEKKAAEYLTKFSSLLRAILANSEKQKIVLAKELEALELYLGLEALRFTTTLNYKIQVDKTIDTSFTRIPPLILQPFVENAIWHGLIPKTNGINKLNINIFRKEAFLIFEVEDNGIGRKQARIKKNNSKHQSMGIAITQKRIELLHSKNQIQIIDLVNAKGEALGTKVNIHLYAPE